MSFDFQTPHASSNALWVGRAVSALPTLLLLSSAVMKLARPTQVAEGFLHLGWPEQLAPALAVIELTCTLLYVIPRTAVLGAIVLTGYLGGATAAHVRIGEPFGIPVVAGVLTWLGLFLRDKRLRALIPLRV